MDLAILTALKQDPRLMVVGFIDILAEDAVVRLIMNAKLGDLVKECCLTVLILGQISNLGVKNYASPLAQNADELTVCRKVYSAEILDVAPMHLKRKHVESIINVDRILFEPEATIFCRTIVDINYTCMSIIFTIFGKTREAYDALVF